MERIYRNQAQTGGGLRHTGTEIRFIQECKSEKSRKAVIEAMNEGYVRVLFGSTSMLGTGVNAQRRAVAIHHLDTPWRPFPTSPSVTGQGG